MPLSCEAVSPTDALPCCAACLCDAPVTRAALRQIGADISRRQMMGGAGAMLGLFAGFGLSPRETRAQTPPRPILFTNLRLFDGEATRIQDGVDILVEGGRIAALPPRGQGPAEAERVDCGGRVAMPGLIDCHWHALLAAGNMLALVASDAALPHLIAAREAGATLRRGFTTVRDMGGPAFALKTAIDRSIVEGPRIFPSGAMISQTAGHGDFRLLHALPRMPRDAPDIAESLGVSALADGADMVLRAAREQLMRGATQLKITAGGGVASLYDPIDTTQFTEREMRAAVEAAEDWGTYVSAHVYVPRGIQRALRAGIRSIEHGQLADEESVRMMAGEGAVWSIQPFLLDEDANPYSRPDQVAAQRQVSEGTERAFAMGRQHQVKMVFGTDILFNPRGGARQGAQLAKLARFMPPLEALRMATGAAGDALAMSGPRAPYPERLGILAPGAAADLLVLDGEPERELSWLERPDESLRVIMKGGAFVARRL